MDLTKVYHIGVGIFYLRFRDVLFWPTEHCIQLVGILGLEHY
jgi:hypothetical protein